MRNYQKWNNIIGWCVWLIAAVVFVSTAERTTSWWDCGEYISTAGKLMVGHPSGAPTFQLLGRIATFFTFGDSSLSAFAVNAMSAICSAFTILFLFWTISMLAKKLVTAVVAKKQGTLTSVHQFMIYASAAVGALAYTFTDSFWFSAVEGEVYAMSSFFTAITFWAILKWEAAAEEHHNLRWIILISFLIGLAIGVHLLNLLVIPAVVFTIYYKKFKTSRKGFWYSMLISLVLLAGILWGIVPWIVKLAGYFELFFVNVLRLPFNLGTVFYFVVLIGAIILGLRYAIKKGKVALHTGLLCLSFLLIGYSTFFILIIRANAGVPLNENEPKDALSLLSYLNREQYGSRPLLYGNFYNAKVIDTKESAPKYIKDEVNKRYNLVGYNVEYVYDAAHCGLFPRMYSNSDSGGRPHIKYYKYWSGTKADVGTDKPTMSENMRFYIRYHLNWMYFRYFMWNFSGRQNNEQGLGYNEDGSRDLFHGNWITGINFLDSWRLGPQDDQPEYLANNQGRNTFFMLPLLLGILGLIYQYRNHRRDCFVVFLLFFMTGIAIVTYLNEPSTEPRERDYAYAGSFYAYSIWIGLGVMALAELLSKKVNAWFATAIVAILSLIFVPGLMAKQGWNDHDRSNRTAAYDFAKNTLLSCAPNGILIANGDNDTFPVWYCQEMEGIRPDVRIINSALANSYWHIQPLFKQNYQSKPLKFTLRKEQYGQNVNDYAILGKADLGANIELSEVLKYLGSSDDRTKQMVSNGEKLSVFPTHRVKVSVPIDDMLKKGLLTPQEASISVNEIAWNVKPNADALYKVDIALLDLFASNKFDRPLHFVSAGAQSDVLPVPQWAQAEGCVYRLVPYQNPNSVGVGAGDNGVNTGISYDLFMNKFRWGKLNDPKTAIDPESAGYSRTVRYQYILLARALVFEGKNDSAVKVLDKSLEFFPNEKIPFDGMMLYQMETYLQAGAVKKAVALSQELSRIFGKRLAYVERFPNKFAASVAEEKYMCLSVFYEMSRRLANYVGTYPELQPYITKSQKVVETHGV